MTVGAVLIDLGEAPRARPPDEDDRAGDIRLPTTQRRVVGLLAAAAMLLTVTTAVPRTEPLAGTIPAESRDMILYGQDAQYVFRLGEGPGDRTVSAFGTPDAVPLWHTRVPEGRIGWLTATPAGARWINLDGTRAEDQAAVVATTGRVLYSPGGQLLGALPGGNALLWTSRGGDFGVEASGVRVVVRDPGTSRLRWVRTMPPGAWLWFDPMDGGLSSVAILLPSGRLEMWDLERNTRLAAADILSRRDPGEPPGSVQLAGELILIEDWHDGRVLATAYGRRRLDRRWTVDLDIASQHIRRCGSRLCVGSLAGGVRMLDGTTGATLWSAREWSFVEPVEDLLVAGPAGARPNGSGLVVLDPATGRVLADLGMWTPVWPLPERGAPIAVRHDLRSSRSWFGRIDVRRGRVFVVGTVTGVTDDCRAGVDYVSCRRPDGSVAVWRIPPA